MRIYNTLTKSKVDFKPLVPGQVSMYVCGPTVYSYAHIGNLRPPIFFDVVHRYFKYLGYDVNHISNYTDIDDKIITAAEKEGISESEVSEKYLKLYSKDMAALNVLPLKAYPKVTDSIKSIIKFIEKLEAKEFAYNEEGNVFFRVNKLPEYGMVSNQRPADLLSGVRKENLAEKENSLDFTLWKKTDKGITWESPWGTGRPGWHTECVVMIDDHFKKKIDIHGGGLDIKFPHHENEVAQSLAANEHTIADYWMHVGMINIEDEKMSKSIGNIILAKDLLKDHNPNTIRLALLSNHYRSPLNFSEALLEQMDSLNERVLAFLRKSFLLLGKPEQTDIKDYEAELNEDFNIPNAVAILNHDLKLGNTYLRNKDKEQLVDIYHRVYMIVSILGLVYDYELSAEIGEKYNKWHELRKSGKFLEADKIRQELEQYKII